MRILGLLLILLLSSNTLYAGNLGTPFAFDSAKVLPKGIRNFRYNNVMAQANDKYDNQGDTIPVGDSLNVSVSYAKLIEGKDTPIERGVLEGYLVDKGKNLDDSAGQTTGVVNVEVDAHVSILAWGITRKWTSAVVVPVVQTGTNVDTGFVASSDLQGLAAQLEAEGKGYKAYEVKNKTDAAVRDKLAKKGYDPLTNESKTMLGDIRIVNKILLSQKENYALALNADMVLPTGEEADINKAVDVPAGDGQFDLGTGLSFDLIPNDKLRLTSKVSYYWQLPDTTARRVPEEADSSLSEDIDPQISRDLGDIFYASLGASYQMDSGLNLKTQYTFQYKERDHYEGTKYQAHRYNWLSKNTRQRMHAIQLGVGFSTIPMFRKKQFPVPLEANVIGGMPLSGKSVTKDPVVIGELAMYF